MHHSVVLYHRISGHFYSEEDGAECMLSCITLCLRWEMNLQWSIAKRLRYCIIVHIAKYDPTIYLIWPPRSTSNVYGYKYGYRLPLNIHSQKSPWLSRLDRQSSKPVVVGSSPAVDKFFFSFCNSRFHCSAYISNQPIQMKSTVTYT